MATAAPQPTTPTPDTNPPLTLDSTTYRIEAAVAEIAAEAARAMRKFASFNSAHEGYAVLLEELDELWDEVKANNLPRALEEAVQVGAMALRFLVDIRALSGTNSTPVCPPENPADWPLPTTRPSSTPVGSRPAAPPVVLAALPPAAPAPPGGEPA